MDYSNVLKQNQRKVKLVRLQREIATPFGDNPAPLWRNHSHKELSMIDLLNLTSLNQHAIIVTKYECHT